MTIHGYTALVIAALVIILRGAVGVVAAADNPADNPSTPTQPDAARATDHTMPWQSVDGGGTAGTSDNYDLDGTAGQTATGSGMSETHTLLHGYWQNFDTGCCRDRTGNVDMIGEFPTEVDSSDLGLLINYLFSPPGTVILPCLPEADVDTHGGDNSVDSSDLGLLIAYLFAQPPGSTALPDCS